MKEAIGGTSLFLIVIVILSAFAMYISLSVNWSTAYKVKDEIIFYIEKNRGVNENTIRDINNYLGDIGYFNYGKCPGANSGKNNGWSGYNINSKKSKAPANSTQYCIAKIKLIKNTENSSGKIERNTTNIKKGSYNTNRGIDKAYYSVRTFFLLDLPIIREMGLTVDGETKVILEPVDFSAQNSISIADEKQGAWVKE